MNGDVTLVKKHGVQLLIENIGFVGYKSSENTRPVILEAAEDFNVSRTLSGVIQRAEQLNQNRRIYPKSILERELEKYKSIIESRTAFGELDHANDSVVNAKNVSHAITQVFWNDNDVVGTLRLLDTPCGNIAYNIIKDGFVIGISSRALGSVKEFNDSSNDTYYEIDDDLEIICWDLVTNPSTHGAYVYPINENITAQQISGIEDKYARVNIILHEMICDFTCNCKVKF